MFSTSESQALASATQQARPPPHPKVYLGITQRSSGCSGWSALSLHNGLSCITAAWTAPAPVVPQQSSGPSRWSAPAFLSPEERSPLSVAELECSPFCRLAEPESDASPLFSVGLELLELICVNTVTSTLSVSWTCGICVLNPAQPRHRPSCRCIVTVVFQKVFESLGSASALRQRSR